MPFDDAAIEQQTSAYAAAVLEPSYSRQFNRGGVPRWAGDAQRAHDIQALLGFVLGLQIEYFHPGHARRYADVLLRRIGWPSGTLETAPLPPELVPIIEELRAGFDAGRYRGPLYPFSAAQLAFRNVLLPVMRLRRSGRNVLMFLDRAMFADDWQTEEGDLASPERRGWRVSDRLLMIDATIGALRYLQTATAAVKTAYQWGDFPHSLLRGDLRTMYRVQLDPRNKETRQRLIRAAQDLAELTAEQTRRIIRQQSPAEWKRVGETGGDDVTRAWQAEAVAIVEEYDDAVNGPGW